MQTNLPSLNGFHWAILWDNSCGRFWPAWYYPNLFLSKQHMLCKNQTTNPPRHIVLWSWSMNRLGQSQARSCICCKLMYKFFVGHTIFTFVQFKVENNMCTCNRLIFYFITDRASLTDYFDHPFQILMKRFDHALIHTDDIAWAKNVWHMSIQSIYEVCDLFIQIIRCRKLQILKNKFKTIKTNEPSVWETWKRWVLLIIR